MTIALALCDTSSACIDQVKYTDGKLTANRYELPCDQLETEHSSTYTRTQLTGKSLPSRKLLPWLQPVHALQLIR